MAVRLNFEDGVLRLFRKRADAVLQKVSLKHLLPAGEKVLLPRGLDEQGHGGLLLCFDTKEYSTARAKKQKKRPHGHLCQKRYQSRPDSPKAAPGGAHTELVDFNKKAKKCWPQ